MSLLSSAITTLEQPQAACLADRDLERRVRIYLDQRGVDARNIGVAALAGEVTLRGAVRSFYHRQLCISCCRRVAGVIRLMDELEVEPRYDDRNSDLAMELEVC